MTDTAGAQGSSIPRPHQSVETAYLPPEAVLFDDRHGEIHHLNLWASAVWLLLDGELSVEEVADELSEIFSSPGDRMRTDVAEAVDDFRRRGLLDGTTSTPEEPRVAVVTDTSDADPQRLDVLPRPPDTCDRHRCVVSPRTRDPR
jgi:hypothetical protein